MEEICSTISFPPFLSHLHNLQILTVGKIYIYLGSQQKTVTQNLAISGEQLRLGSDEAPMVGNLPSKTRMVELGVRGLSVTW